MRLQNGWRKSQENLHRLDRVVGSNSSISREFSTSTIS